MNKEDLMIKLIEERLSCYSVEETIDRLHSYGNHKYSVFKEGVAYCASCGKTLEHVEGKESYE